MKFPLHQHMLQACVFHRNFDASQKKWGEVLQARLGVQFGFEQPGEVNCKRSLHEMPRLASSKKRDPNRPHGYISGFNFFARDHRPILLEEQPGLKFQPGSTNLVNKRLGQIWKHMTKEQRGVYEQKAVLDKCRYLQVSLCEQISLQVMTSKYRK